MALDLEEQEQVAELKAWWQQHGSLVAAVLLDEKAYDEALKLLEAKHAAAFDAQYDAARGDVLVAKNDTAQAKTAYRAALEKAGPGNSAFSQSVRMRLDALGGG